MKSADPARTRGTGGVNAVSLGEQFLVLAATLIASLIAIGWSWSHNAFLLYGDAEAHIHIARRLFDSHRPGITQLGSVWLPLPHLLLVPFLLVDPWWRSGFAAVIPSAACYLLACLGLYRLMRIWLSPAPAAFGLALFAANPNLLYLQTTAMTEPLFLCELIWAVLLLVKWRQSLDSNDRRTGRLLWAVIFVLIAAVYTRYDGWILAFLAWIAMALCLYHRKRLFRLNFILASSVLLLAPISWMAYNAVVFGDWLDFMRGPYSARAIELRTASSSVEPHPGWHNLWTSLVYFTKCAEMDIAALSWGELVFIAAIIGTLYGWLRSSKSGFAWTLFLWLPLPFYAYSVAYGSVPIFIPVWKPFSWYNTRYGMELLPALACFFAFAVQAGLLRMKNTQPRWRITLQSFLILLLVANIFFMLRQGPLTYIEAKKNSESRGYYNLVLAQSLARLHTLDPNGVVLMDTSTFPSLVPHAGLTYRQTINESDKEWYWAALAAPATHADIVLAFAGDEIDKAVRAHPQHLRVYQSFQPTSKAWDQAVATIYVTDTFPVAPPPQPSTAPTGR
jgi:Dolichyl-phosphate-mannose-protein mannosyltransferase